MSNYLNHQAGFKSWALTIDHKRIGVMYLIVVSFSFFLGALAAGLLRIDLYNNTPVLMNLLNSIGIELSDTPEKLYNKLFTLHGTIMVFLFIIPSIPAIMGNFILPIHIGAVDVAFPKLNLASFYIYCFGAIFALVSIITGGIDTGWTFYTPYSSGVDTDWSVIWILLGAFILGFSSILTAINFIVTVHKMRVPGMTWMKMPLMVWSLYATAIIQLFATPVLAITVLLLIFEKTLGIAIFDPALGGDPVIFQHFFWFYSHPAVYIMILPAMGIISELITAFCKKNIFGYRLIAFSSLGIALISFLVWGHHMFTSGQSEFATILFSFLTFFVAIPSGIKVFNWVATMYKGAIELKTPFLYALGFIILFCIGGFTGVMLATVSLDLHFHDTYFVVAHFHYVMVGGTVFAFIGGLHYWWPKMFGKMYNEFWAVVSFVFIFIGFNVTFLPQFLLGSKGMPRRYYYYLDEFRELHQLSTIGTWILGLGFIIMAIYLYLSLKKGKPAENNPWGAKTLEWSIQSPPIHHNFEKIPTITKGPYNYD